MFIAMNRFRIVPGREDEFLTIWKNRNSRLSEVPGFKEFHLLKGASTEQFTLFASHVVWESEAAFAAWTHSDAFRESHARAAQTPRDLYAGPPQLEMFEVVM